MKIACLFPGIGYTCDRPLLYYAGKLLAAPDREVIRLSYGGFPKISKGSPEDLRLCAETALAQTETQLIGTDWSRYEDILFVSKSIGTVVAAAFAAQHGISCRQVFLTPVEATFGFGVREGIAFHGTADPWADTERIRKACEGAGIPLYLTEGANHSLETGDVLRDLETMKKTMEIVRAYAGEVR